MNFVEALEKISDYKGSITRDTWQFYLKFNREGYLILLNSNNDELTPYTISLWDFKYDWMVKE